MNGHHGGRVVDDTHGPHTPSSCSEDSDDGDWRDRNNFRGQRHSCASANKRFKISSWDTARHGRYGAMCGEFGRFGFAQSKMEQRMDYLASPPALHRGCPPPISFWSNREQQEFIVISASYIDGSIYLYDSLNDSWHRVRSYGPRRFKPYNHGQCMVARSTSNELYVFGGVFAMFGLFDLCNGSNAHHSSLNDKIYDISAHSQDLIYWFPVSIFIPKYNAVHIFAEIKHKSLHSIYSCAKSQLLKHFISDGNSEFIGNDDGDDIDINLYPIFYCCKVVYVEHLNAILMFNGLGSNIYIWIYSLMNKKWRLFKTVNDKKELIVTPKKNTNNFDVSLLHDRIIVLCYFSIKEVWCANVDDIVTDHKWSKKNIKQFESISVDHHMVTSTDCHYTHFINTVSPSHAQIWTYCLLPNRILKRCYIPLIVSDQIRGTLHLALANTDNKNIKINIQIPHIIIKLISNYCINMFH